MAEAHTTRSHSESTRFYWIVAAFLTVFTIVEVVVTLIGLPDLLLFVILMVLSVIKGASVVMFFMHLRGDPRVYQLLFIGPFTLACSMVLIFLALFSGHAGIGG
jgi:caa(3)-type oxidase subunit IV